MTVSGRGGTFETGAGGKLRLPPGEYTVTATGTGVVVEPQRQKVKLGAGGAETVRIVARPAITGASGASAAAHPPAHYNFAHPQRKVLALNLGLVDAPAMVWTADGRWIVAVVAGDPGLVRVNVATGKAGAVITQAPDPPFGRDAGTSRGAAVAFVIGKTVVYVMNLRYWFLGEYRMAVMAVPLSGGKPVKLFEFDSAKATLLGARAGSDGQPEFLLAGEIGGRKGLFLLRGTSPRVEQAKLVVESAALAKAVAVTRDWKRVIVINKLNTVGPSSWSIYTFDGKTVARLPDSLGLFDVALSPDLRYVAAVQRQKRGVRLVAFALNNPGRVWVLASGAINYGAPSWSPDGKFIAARAYAGHNREQLLLIRVAR